jgi:hypothetical protein
MTASMPLVVGYLKDKKWVQAYPNINGFSQTPIE